MENTKLKIIHEYLKYDLDPYVFVIHLISIDDISFFCIFDHVGCSNTELMFKRHTLKNLTVLSFKDSE